jgi:hypothetical protein
VTSLEGQRESLLASLRALARFRRGSPLLSPRSTIRVRSWRGFATRTRHRPS